MTSHRFNVFVAAFSVAVFFAALLSGCAAGRGPRDLTVRDGGGQELARIAPDGRVAYAPGVSAGDLLLRFYRALEEQAAALKACQAPKPTRAARKARAKP